MWFVGFETCTYEPMWCDCATVVFPLDAASLQRNDDILRHLWTIGSNGNCLFMQFTYEIVLHIHYIKVFGMGVLCAK